MGQVYRARDMTLDRDVAIKVLPKAFTDDPDRLARFEREAKVLASLETFDSRIVAPDFRFRCGTVIRRISSRALIARVPTQERRDGG